MTVGKCKGAKGESRGEVGHERWAAGGGLAGVNTIWCSLASPYASRLHVYQNTVVAWAYVGAADLGRGAPRYPRCA